MTSDQRLAEENARLRQQTELFRITLASIGDAVITTDIEGRVVHMNAAAEALTGWTQKAAAGQPLETVFRILNEQTRQTVENPVKKVLAEGKVVGLANHTLLIAKDGRERPIDDSAAPIQDEQGKVAGVVVIFRDITERRKGERLIEDARKYAEGVVETVREPLVVLTADLRVKTANRAFYQTFKVKSEETESRLIYQLGNGQWDIPRLRALLEEILPKNTSFHDYEVKHDFPAIGPKTMLLNARRLQREGNHTELILLAIEDITERKQAEHRLKVSEVRFRRLFETAKDGILVLDTYDAKITDANPYMCELLGYSRADLLGKELWEIGLFQDIKQSKAAMRELQRKHYIRYDDLPLKTKSGHRIDVEFVSNVYDEDHVSVVQCNIRDITERRRVEEALRESEQRFRALFELGPVAVYSCDASGVIVSYNRRAAELWGREPKPKDTDERFCGSFKLCRPDGTPMPHEQCPMAEVLCGKVPGAHDAEVVIERPDGSCVTVIVNIRALKNERGEITGALNCFYDITERKQAEELLRKSEQRLASLIESSNDAIISKSLDGIIQSWNPAAERLFGYTAEQAVGQSINLIIPADRADEEERIIALLRAGERVEHFDTVRVRSDGQLIQVSLTISPIKDSAGRVIGASKIARDIGERKRAEVALYESEARLAAELAATQALQGISTQLIYEEDQQSLYERILDAAVAIMHSDFASLQILHPERGDGGELRLLGHRGFTAKAAQRWQWIRVDHPTSCGMAFRTGARCIVADVETCEFITDTEERLAYRETGIRAVQSTPLYSRAGTKVGMVSTHWREPHQPAERDLRLLDILARQAADLMERKQAEETLKEADRRKDEFLAMLAHELRNPLAPIRNALQIIRFTGGKGEPVTSASEMMERQVGQMARLVDDLLDVSRISRGKIELRKGRIELASAVNHAVEAASALVQCMEHDLTVTLPPKPIYLNADPTRLAQVVGNLLNNACKFTDKGGHIWLTVEQVSDHAVIRVRDTGIGIAADQLPRIFDMFTQVDSSLERSVSGLGIGLSLVKSLAELHGGTVEVHSAGVGKGSEFIVRLPIMVETAKPPPQPIVSEQMPAPARRILVVDDNRDSARSLAMLLKVTGNETHTAFDGLEAVETAATFKPDVVLLDIGLPKLNGYEACRRIRASSGKNMVLVALSGWGQDEDHHKSKEAGFDGHLVKPASHDDIMKLLDKLQK